jgi:hypothetical protein
MVPRLSHHNSGSRDMLNSPLLHRLPCACEPLPLNPTTYFLNHTPYINAKPYRPDLNSYLSNLKLYLSNHRIFLSKRNTLPFKPPNFIFKTKYFTFQNLFLDSSCIRLIEAASFTPSINSQCFIKQDPFQSPSICRKPSTPKP